jgi:hypothetical protein
MGSGARQTDRRAWTPDDLFFLHLHECHSDLPALQHDPSRPEDVDSEAEDHAPDEIRYVCKSRPYVKQVPSRVVSIRGAGENNNGRSLATVPTAAALESQNLRRSWGHSTASFATEKPSQ